MTQAHTPGPWIVRASGPYFNQVAIDPAIGCAYGAGAEVRANAAVMSAAPELLKALKDLLPVFESMTEDGWGENYTESKRFIDAARAAIRKAQP